MSSGILQRGAIARAIADMLARLASSAVGVGAALIGYKYGTVAGKFGEMVSVTDFGAKGDGNDDIAAVLRARAASNFLHFPRIGGAATTYVMGWFQPGDLSGTTISTDEGVTLSFASNAYSLYKNIVMENDVRVFFRDIGSKYVFPKTPSSFKKDALPMLMPAQASVRTALDCTNDSLVAARVLLWNTYDDFNDSAVTRTADALAFPDRGNEAFRGAFVDVGPYETVSAYFDSGVTKGPIGIILRGTGGFTVLYSSGGDGNYTTASKVIGQPLTGNIANMVWPVLGQGVYQSYRAENSVWSVTRLNHERVIIKLNGKALTTPDMAAIGGLVEVGFVTYGMQAFSVSGLTLERRTDAVIGAQLLQEVRIFGDSMAERYPGSWDQYLIPMIDGVAGLRLRSVTNFAVAGTTLDQAYAAMQANGLGNALHVVVCAGTNNIQGQLGVAAFKTVVANVIDYIQGQGRRPVIVIPGMWYTKAQSGGTGQDSANYERGAPYRMAMERIAVDKKCIVVKLTDELPNPDPAYLTNSPDSVLVRDNIHHDVVGSQMDARAIAQAIVNEYLSVPGCVASLAGPGSFLNGVTGSTDFRFNVDKGGEAGIGGTIRLAAPGNNIEVMQLPRWCSPQHDMPFMALAYSADGNTNLGACYLAYSSGTRRLTLRGAPAGTVVLVIQTARYKAA